MPAIGSRSMQLPPYMLMVADLVKDRRRAMTAEEQARFGIDKLNAIRSEIPAVTHVDYSARIQTVHRDTNPTYHGLLERFRDLTGCPVIVNTSFNVRGEPIVCTPEDAFRCFMGTDIERLVVGNAMLSKEQQNSALRQDYKNAFALDRSAPRWLRPQVERLGARQGCGANLRSGPAAAAGPPGRQGRAPLRLALLPATAVLAASLTPPAANCAMAKVATSL